MHPPNHHSEMLQGMMDHSTPVLSHGRNTVERFVAFVSERDSGKYQEISYVHMQTPLRKK